MAMMTPFIPENEAAKTRDAASMTNGVQARWLELAQRFRLISVALLDHANKGIPREDFFREISGMLLEYSTCDVVELWVQEREKSYRYRYVRATQSGRLLEAFVGPRKPRPGQENDSLWEARLERFAGDVLVGRAKAEGFHYTPNGSLWSSELRMIMPDAAVESCMLIPFLIDGKNNGILLLEKKEKGFFTLEDIQFNEGLALTLGVAIANRRAQHALRERIKELTCLYAVSRLAEHTESSLGTLLQGVVELLPAAWQYPKAAAGRIVLDDQAYTTPDFGHGRHGQSADLVIGGEKRGSIEVFYVEDKPELDEGPFLKEERSLIDTLARQIALIIERRQADEDKGQLQEQLRHADRLATIGHMAAGVAHELNEPLASILGFAQLAQKKPDLASQTREDIDKIVGASLHAREIVKKLLIFARQTPPVTSRVNLNTVVEEALFLLEPRCSKNGITVVRELERDLPDLTADPSQLSQVMVNLIVNAAQAMPRGGKLLIRTALEGDQVLLVVQDAGVGMTPEVLKKIFLPFFTTKDVGQGTGLGLPVVHGIVTGHGGTIRVESRTGEGSRFEIRLPLRHQPELHDRGTHGPSDR
jgi:signal transduction histidine kinase